jgi:hypothetical protein
MVFYYRKYYIVNQCREWPCFYGHLFRASKRNNGDSIPIEKAPGAPFLLAETIQDFAFLDDEKD